MKTTSKQHFLGSIVLLLALLTCEIKTTMYNGFCKFYDFYYLSLMQLHKYTSKPESWSRQGNGTVVPYRSLLYTRKPWKGKKESKEFLGKVQLQNCLNDAKQVVLDSCVSEKAGTLSNMNKSFRPWRWHCGCITARRFLVCREVRLTGNFKLAVGVDVSVNGCKCLPVLSLR